MRAILLEGVPGSHRVSADSSRNKGGRGPLDMPRTETGKRHPQAANPLSCLRSLWAPGRAPGQTLGPRGSVRLPVQTQALPVLRKQGRGLPGGGEPPAERGRRCFPGAWASAALQLPEPGWACSRPAPLHPQPSPLRDQPP